MTREERIQALKKSFHLQPSQEYASDDSGYFLKLEISLQDPNLADSYRVQLCGINPITCEDVAEQNHTYLFDAMRSKQTSSLLQYHGRFQLRCTGFLRDEEFPIGDYELNLKYEKNKPVIRYCVNAAKNGFQNVKIFSNCWPSCRELIWLYFDGHAQRVTQPVIGNAMDFYVAAAGDISLSVYNPNQNFELVVSRE